jgi:hypothetical protein
MIYRRTYSVFVSKSSAYVYVSYAYSQFWLQL